MNVLFLYSESINPLRGGIERVTFVLSSFFQKKGITCYFMSLRKSSDIGDERQFYLPDSSSFRTSSNISYFCSFLLNKGIDVINQGGLGPQSSELSYYSRECGVKLVSVVHNSLLAPILNFPSTYYNVFCKYKITWLLPYVKSKSLKKILLFLYRIKYKGHYKKLCLNSDKVLLLSEKFKEELSFYIGPVPENIIGVANPLSFSICDVNFSVKKRELLFVGRINAQQKRVDLLLKIWEKLCHKYEDWSLIIVGGGRQLDEMRQLAANLKLVNVKFEGFQDPKSYYERASIFCMTSSYEGFGIVLVEAMQYGVVPMAFNSYISVTDIIENGVNGILIEPFDIDAYVSQLSLLMDNEEMRMIYANNAFNNAKKFSIENIGSCWLNLLNDLS
jgi:glycosyltransferase involved in cell wall biosynthesis